MHELSTDSLLGKYTLRGVFRDPLTMTIGSMAMTAVGAGVSAMGTIAGGNAAAQAGQMAGAAALDAGQRQQAVDEFRAKQEDMAAQESRAVAQRSAFEKQREGRFALSSLQARAAAGGGGAADPTILNLGGDIAQRSEYDALFDMSKGENTARGYESTATGLRMTGDAALYEGLSKQQALIYEGNAKQSASRLSAAGTLIGGAGSMFRQYNVRGGRRSSDYPDSGGGL